MKRLLTWLMLSCLYGCSDTSTIVAINSEDIEARPNRISMKLDYLGSDDTRFAGIAYTDSLHVYKLKSFRVDEYENFVIGVYAKNYSYAIDSSADGGKHWATIPRLIELEYTQSTLNTERVIGFFVSPGGHHKYIVTTECLYFSINNGPFQQYKTDNKNKS